MEQITLAQAEEAAYVFSFAPPPKYPSLSLTVFLAAEAMSGTALSEWYPSLRKNPPAPLPPPFWKRNTAPGGKGFRIGGSNYAVWFNKEGLRIAPGRTTLSRSCPVIPWFEVAVRVEQLLQEGRFATQEKMGLAPVNEKRELEERLWYLRQEFSEAAREADYMPTINRLYGGFPDSTRNIAEHLADPEQRAVIRAELSAFATAYRENPELLRFRKIHNPSQLLRRLEDLEKPPKHYPTDPDFTAERPTFITQDEIDRLLARGSNISEGKLRIYAHYKQGHDAQERIRFLKSEYGTGGQGHRGYNEMHDGKGISLTRADEISGFTGYDKVFLNWGQVEKRIGELIRSDRYLNPQENDYLPEYDKQQIARAIIRFQNLYSTMQVA